MSSANSKHVSFDVNKILDAVPLLSSLSRTQKKELAKELKKQNFDSNDIIMKEGEEGDSFYIIVDGKVEVKSEKAGHLAYLHSGDYAGEQALLRSMTRNATLVCVEPTRCLVCSKGTFDNIKNKVKFAKREGKRRAYAIKNMDEDKKEEKEDNVVSPTKKETIDWILECVSDNLLFLKLDREQKERVVKKMRLIEVKKGGKLITQGETNAQTFYVTDTGEFDILVDNVKVGGYKRGGCFGELALLYESPRAATIIATTDCKVWEVSRTVLRYEIQQAYKQKNASQLRFIKKIDLFKPLLSQELSQLSDALEVVEYKQGDVVIKEGDVGDRFYILKKGTVIWSKSSGESGELLRASYFGERALRRNDRRAATIECKTDCIIYEMNSKDFKDLLGPVTELMDERIQLYAHMEKEYIKKKSMSQIAGKDKGAAEGDQKDKSKKDQGKPEKETLIRDSVCSLGQLKEVGVLGRGAFGLVTLVINPQSNKPYALKAIKKSQIIELGQQEHILSEKEVMAQMCNKFLVNLHTTYKDKLRVYFLLDVCLGGELFTILRQRRYFDESTARFYTSCVVEAFAYMHEKDIIYRDLKPENLVLDNEGYLKITDFGFAKVCQDKTFTLCGTPDYLAPEIVTGQGHGRAVDWWTLGVLIYEMLASFPPFFDDEPIETYRKIIRGRVKFPRYFTLEAKDLIRGFLRNKPTKRLGILKGKANLIRQHSWFIGFDWKKLYKGELKAPIVNQVKSITDLSNFVNNDDDEEDEPALPVDPALDFGKYF